MKGGRIEYVYLDHEDDVKSTRLSMGSLISAQEKYGKDDWANIPGMTYALWYTLGMPGGSDGFMDWANKVALVMPDKEDETDPMLARPSPASLTSVSLPA